MNGGSIFFLHETWTVHNIIGTEGITDLSIYLAPKHIKIQ
jgi:hypothetical protein